MGIPVNVAIALYSGVVAAVADSAWLGTLCAYYLLLGIMRAYWGLSPLKGGAPDA